MLAVVKTPRIKLKIEGDIPRWIISRLKKEYGQKVFLDDNDEYVDISETGWYKSISRKMTPGDALKIYRSNHKMTQVQLGAKLGIRPQHISDMEKNRRAISKKTALKLAKLFHTSVDRFIK